MELRRDKAYRIRNIPESVTDRFQAARLLVGLEPALGPVDNISLSPLTSDANYWKVRSTKTTIATFKKLPPLLDDGSKSQWVLQARSAGFLSHDIIIDCHFLGFTVLNNVDEKIHIADCIAISGLASHAFGSWKHRGSPFMWLRDALPEDVPTVRSIIYGYDTELLKGTSFQTVHDIAKSFVLHLKNIGRSSLSAKPVIFLAHSLGGIILKHAVLLLAKYGESERYILESIKAILFFGVPSKGMTIKHLLPMVEGQPNRDLVQVLKADSPTLKELDAQFQGILHLNQIRMVCCYETKTSPTRQMAPDGSWSISGPHEILVPPESAVLEICKELDKVPINEDHSSIVKFGQRDHNYQTVVSYIHEITANQQVEKPTGNTTRELLELAPTIPVPGQDILSLEDVRARPDGKLPLYSSLEPTPKPKQQRGYTDASRNLLSTARNHVTPLCSPESDESPTDIDLHRKMMSSLAIERPHDSFSEIEEAHGSTFGWIFEDESLGFVDWLAGGSGIYWINGKPGSGKSTLMKYIYCQQRTWLNISKGSANHVHAAFFFHNRGTHMQKSFEGLYRSVIHQILLQERRLQTLVAPIYRRLESDNQRSWSLQDLKDALEKILDQDILPLNVFLFLDALDEYDGPPEIIADFVKATQSKWTTSSKTVQVLCSSRPWAVFSSYFDSFPSVQVHRHTKPDIREFASDWLESHHTVLDLAKFVRPNDGEDRLNFVETIVERAQGVFLWVKLALKDLLGAAIRGDSPEELMKTLLSVPQELHEFYAEIIRRLPDNPVAWDECYTMLEVALCASGQLRLFEFWAACECAKCNTLSDCLQKLKYRELPSALVQDFTHRIQERCGGLLEVVSLHPETLCVQFMHQTVKDFVGGNYLSSRITGTDSEQCENGYHFLAKVFLAKSLKDNYDPFLRTGVLLLAISAMTYAQYAESTSGKSLCSFLDSIPDESIAAPFQETFYATSSRESEPSPFPINSVLSFAVVADLRLYIEEKLSCHPLVNRNPDISLLHCAVLATLANSKDLSQLASTLIKHGADKEASFQGLTPFQTFFYKWDQKYGFDKHSRTSIAYLNMLSLFLESGQSPDSLIEVDGEINGRKHRRQGYRTLRCRPLHVANIPLTRVLLQYHADVNALDEDGHTPLDIAYGVGWNVYQIGDPVPPEEAYERAMLLLLHGGRATDAIDEPASWESSKSIHSAFLEMVGRHFAIDPRLRNPPRLEKNQSRLETKLTGSEKTPSGLGMKSSALEMRPSRLETNLTRLNERGSRLNQSLRSISGKVKYTIRRQKH